MTPARHQKNATRKTSVETAKCILVVEDEAVIAELLREIFEEEGYRVVLARDGLVAWERLQEDPVDLVISDIMMPRMDGRELMQHLVAHPLLNTVPVILVSAAPFPTLPRVPHSAFMRKPFDPNMLLELADRLLNDPPSGT